jgi:hypothetical protein
MQESTFTSTSTAYSNTSLKTYFEEDTLMSKDIWSFKNDLGLDTRGYIELSNLLTEVAVSTINQLSIINY